MEQRCSKEGSKRKWLCGYNKRETKRVKYNQERLPGGREKDHVTPVVFDNFGRWGVEAEKLLNNLAEKSRDIEGRKNTAEFRNYWRRRFSIVLQWCNSKVILNKLARISSSSNQVETLFDRDIKNSVHSCTFYLWTEFVPVFAVCGCIFLLLVRINHICLSVYQ